MPTLGNVEEPAKPTACEAAGAPTAAPAAAPATAASTAASSQPPPPVYGAAPPSYGAHQQSKDAREASNPSLPSAAPTNPAAGAPPSYGDRPPAYNGTGARGGFTGAPRRNFGGGNLGGSMDEGQAADGAAVERRDSRYKSRICQNYLNGTCTWGAGCSYVHTNYDGPTTTRPFGSPNSSNANAPSFGGAPAGGAPPPSYERSSQPPPYHSSPTKAPPRTPPPMQGFPAGGAQYAGSPISPRSPMKLSSPTGTGTGQRFRHEPYSALGKAFSSENLHGLASGHQSPRDQSASVLPAAPSTAAPAAE